MAQASSSWNPLLTFPEMYERHLVAPLFQPWAELVLERVQLQPKDRVLDVACGTGIVARLAKRQLGNDASVVGIDSSEPMLAVAKSVDPGIDWRRGNAAALPVRDDEKFDVIVCQQGLQFFPEKQTAIGEIRRVLAPGGRIAVSTWRSLEENALFRDLHRVAERHLGSVVDHRHGFGDSGALQELLTAAGFHDVQVEAMSRLVRFEDGATFLRLNTTAIAGMSAAGKAMSEEERARTVNRILADSSEVASSYMDGSAIAFEISSNVATARG
ncbi:MAG TPA: methyltransferase domain-containing protein [bacterium]|nr:methyltransferase domain-containing protein [bacterium]